VEGSGYVGRINFQDTLRFQVNVSGDANGDINPINAETIGYSLRNSSDEIVYFNDTVSHISKGNYEIFINPELIGITNYDDENYYELQVFATTIGYGASPDSLTSFLWIDSISTSGSLFNNTSPMGSTFEVYWGTTFNVTMVYSANAMNLQGATTNLNWQYDENVVMMEQESNGYVNYTYMIDTSKALGLGQYAVDITASLLNHTTTEIEFDLIIKAIPTGINSTDTEILSDLLLISSTFNESDSVYYNFSYIDTLHENSLIPNASTYKYSWNRIGGEESGTNIPMNISSDGRTYILDFNTSSLDLYY